MPGKTELEMKTIHHGQSTMDPFKLDGTQEVSGKGNSVCHMSLSEWSTIDKTTLTKYPFFNIDDDRPIESIIRPANAEDGNVQSVLAVANNGPGARSVRQVPWGHLVHMGEIRTLHCNGQIYVIGPGRWTIKGTHRCFAKWGKQVSLTNDNVTDGPFTFVRVRRGQLGLAVENGKPVLLQEGVHVYNNPLFSFTQFKPVDAEHVQHMSYHVVRVPRGCFGKITEQARAKLLPEGTHAVDNAVFEYQGLAKSLDEYIRHGTIHIIQVPKGSLGLVFESSCPVMLEEGVHLYDSPTLKFVGIHSKQQAQIIHGTISRFRVQKGQVGLAWLDNEPVLIENPGTYEVDSSNFQFGSLEDASKKIIALGAKKIVTVYEGEVGVTYKAGTLAVLRPGRHYIDSADHMVDAFLSTQQLSLRLNKDKDLLACDTKDLVKIGIRADVFYRICDPEKALTQVGRTFIPELVKETSIATLNNIVRSTNLGEIATSPQPSAQSEKEQAEKVRNAQATGEASAPLFFDKAHDQFLAKLHDDFMSRYGLEITNIRIEEFKIMNDSLAQSIAGQAIKTAATQSELANLEGQTRIATQQQEREARMQQIRAEAEARNLQISAQAEKTQAEVMAAAQQVRSDAEANTTRTRAQAEADAILMAAKAEAEAISLKARAEAERAQLLAQTPLGEKLSLLEVYGDVVKRSNEGVEKVVYMDPSATSAGNPLALLTMQSLQKDLSQLSTQN